MRKLVAGLMVGLGAMALAFWALSPAPDDAAPPPNPMAALLAAEAPDRPGPAPDWTLELPADHGAHTDTARELWQLSAHLEAKAGPIGVQFNLARLALDAPADPQAAPDWAARDLYRGHLIVADPARGVASEERLSRALPGIALARPEAMRLDDWSLRFDDGHWRLDAGTGDTRITLGLTPARPPLAADDGAAPFHGYAQTRLEVTGTLHQHGTPQPVRGHAWFDHAWGDLPVPGAGAAVVSDRLLVQLDDGSDLSLTRSRRADGGGRATLEGFAVTPDGTLQALESDTARATVTETWQGWPVAWALDLDGLTLEVTPLIDDQTHDFMAPLWSGLVRAEGTRNGQPVAGLGTLTLNPEGLE